MRNETGEGHKLRHFVGEQYTLISNTEYTLISNTELSSVIQRCWWSAAEVQDRSGHPTERYA